MGFPIGIDHLIVATPTLRATVEEFSNRLGVTLAPGGQHLQWGTRNYLASLGEGRYLEIIGPDDDEPEPEQPRPLGIDQLPGARLAAWVAGVTEIDAAVRAARDAGFDPGPVLDASRERPDGGRLSWRMTPIRAGVVPFLIDWTGSPHPSTTSPQGLRFVELRAWHPEPSRAQAELTALGIDLQVAPGPEERLSATIAGPDGELHL
jgi:hypothetical protein